MKRNGSSTDFKQKSLQITMAKPQNHLLRNTYACAPPICISLPPGLCVQGDFRLPCSPGSGWFCLRSSTGKREDWGWERSCLPYSSVWQSPCCFLPGCGGHSSTFSGHSPWVPVTSLPSPFPWLLLAVGVNGFLPLLDLHVALSFSLI